MIIVGASFHLFLLLYPLLLARRRGHRFISPGLKKFLREALWSIPILIAALILVSFLHAVLLVTLPDLENTPTVYEQVASTLSGTSLIPIFVLMFTLGPVAEEVFFRGFLYRVLRNRLPVIPAALIQSAIFGVIHPTPGLHQVYAFGLGLLLTAAYEWRKSLIAPILTHTLFNSMAAIAFIGMAIETANTPMLGIQVDDDSNVCIVQSVAPGSGAEKAGIAKGDTIVEINGRKVRTYEALKIAIRENEIGDVVPVMLMRDGERIDAQVELKKWPREAPRE